MYQVWGSNVGVDDDDGDVDVDVGWNVGIGDLCDCRYLDPHRPTVTDSDLLPLRGLVYVSMVGCTGVTDAGMAYLSGVCELDMMCCNQEVC
jgi:hypothetical protein